MRPVCRLSALLGIASLMSLPIACSEGGAVAPGEDPGTTPAFVILDGANGGNEGFFFLPPLVADPGAFDAGFNGSQSPVVRICDPAGCAAGQLAQYTMATGPGSETVRVVPADEHYIVNWHTDQFDVSAGQTYRVHVFAAGEQLGFADVQLAASGQEARNVTTGQLIGLVGGRTLPIKFRIEEGAAAERFPVTSSDGGTIASSDGKVSLQVPPAALGTDTEITAEPVDPPPGMQSAVTFGPAGLQFTQPVTLTLSYSAAALPPGVVETDLALNTFEDGQWIVVPNSSVNPATGTVSAPIHHFSKFAVGPANRAVFCSGDSNANTFETMDGALAAVAVNGTVAVCDGTHAVEGVIVSRPVTIEAKGGAAPVLQTAAQSATFFVDGYTAGTVVIDGLNFEITTPYPGPDGLNTYAIYATGTYAGLTVRNATFTVGPVARGGIAVITSTVAPTVSVDNVSIDGGVFAIAAIDVTLDVTNSQFLNGRNRRVQYSRSSGRIEGNSFSDCGSAWCVHVRDPQSSVDIVNNTFAAHTLTGVSAPDLNTPVFIRLGATATVTGNDIQGCGYWSCISVESGATALITGNTFTHVAGTPGFQFISNIEARINASVIVDGNQHTSCGYACYKILDASTAVIRNESVNVTQGHGTGPVLVGARDDPAVGNNVITFKDNVVTATAPTDPLDGSTYAAQDGVGISWTDATLNRNTFTHVRAGVVVHSAGTVTGSDNVFTDPFIGMSIHDSGTAQFNYNDFVNPVHAIEDFNGTSNLRCNWWGSAAGPQGILQPIPAAVWTPFATAPIAGTGNGGCVP